MRVFSRGVFLPAFAMCFAAISSGVALGADSAPAGAAGPFKAARTMTIGGEGRWDWITVDPSTGLLYVPRQTHTQVIREDTGEVVGDIQDTAGVHGVALAPDAGYGFTSNGKAGSMSCFDLKTLKPVSTITAGKNPDAIVYDPASKLVLAFNGGSNDLTAIPAADAGIGNARTQTLALPGKPEAAVADGRGHVYVNLEDQSAVADIDTKAMKVVNVWKIEGGEEPTGLAIDAARHRLFIGCHNQVMAVLDTQTGKTLGTAPIGKGVDACDFDPATGEAFASCGDGTVTVVKETSPGKFEATQTVQTRRGARTMVLDRKTHTLYLPTAEYEADAGDGRPAPKAGSFMIVVVSR